MALCEGKRRSVLFLSGLLIGAAVFIALFGVASLDFTDDGWILGGYIEQDLLQHYLGWLSYRAAPISLPLCITTQFNHPEGISAAYTDSIPIFCVLFRLLEPLLPETFQFFGLFNLLSFSLMGGCSALLLSLFCRGAARPLLGCALFSLNPILLERAFRHTALTAQWLIVLALYLYFEARGRRGPVSLWYIGLCALSATIHAYFVPMLCAILLASALEYGFMAKKPLRPALTLAGGLAAALAAAWSVGFFHTSANNVETGYGYFSMNLNSLFNPASRGIDSWSAVLPVWKQGLGSYEGFNYLGLGALLVCLAAAVWAVLNFKKKRLWSRFLALLRGHWALAAVCALLSVYAVSNVVELNSFTLFEIELPWPLINLFSNLRASGRMFWTVNYLILLGCVVFIVNALRPRHAALALAAVCAVQAADMTPAILQKRDYLENGTPGISDPYTSEFWDAAFASYSNIFTLDTRGVHEPLFLALRAVENGMTTNDPFTARCDLDALGDDIDEEIERVKSGDIDPDTLYITTYEGTFMRYADYFMGRALCARVNSYWYVFAPYTGEMKGAVFNGPEVLVYDELAFTIADYTDEKWSGGVLNEDVSTVCFYDNNTNRGELAGASALLLDGEEYGILSASYADSGWIIVKLDRSGEPLRGVELGALKPSGEEAAS